LTGLFRARTRYSPQRSIRQFDAVDTVITVKGIFYWADLIWVKCLPLPTEVLHANDTLMWLNSPSL